MRDAAYAIDWVQDGTMALAALRNVDYGLLLLDLGLPGKSGLDVLQALRHGERCDQRQMPVIILTARDSVADRVKGLDYGADDYLVKPFSIDELLARIRAVVRREHGSANPLLTTSRITFDPATGQVLAHGQSWQLSAREHALLQGLMLRPGNILTREKLEELVYGWNEEVTSNAIEFIIHGLRKKLGKDSIKNIRGLGWMVIK